LVGWFVLIVGVKVSLVSRLVGWSGLLALLLFFFKARGGSRFGSVGWSVWFDFGFLGISAAVVFCLF
jgi:hypothetical protein